MKQYLIFIVLCSFGFATLAQNNQDQTSEEIVLPSNRTALNDLLEDIKKKTTEAEEKNKTLNKYSQSLLEYKERIKNFEPIKIEAIFNDMSTALSSKSNDDIIFQEKALTSFFQPLYYYYSNGFIDENDPTSSDFKNKLTDALKPIMTNPILSIVISNNRFSENQKPTIDKGKFDNFKTEINFQVLTEIKNKLNSAIEGEISSNIKNIDLAFTDLKKIKSNRTKILEKLNEQETQINDLAIKLGLPLFCLTILLLFLVPSFVKTNSTTNVANSQNSLVEISTVLLLTMTILILGLSGKIQSDVLGTLIGGISGYVLNRIRVRSDTTPQS